MRIIDERGKTLEEHPLQGSHVLIGRCQEAGIRLDNDTVSRKHAELLRDPFGRWIVRDLGSRNGTKIRGQKVVEHALNPYEVMELGSFRLQWVETGQLSTDQSADAPALLETTAAEHAELVAMDEHAPLRIETRHLDILSEMAHDLAVQDDPHARQQMLCEMMTRQEFGAKHAILLRMNRQTPFEKPLRLYVAGQADESVHVSGTLLRKMLELDKPILGSNVREGTAEIMMSISASVASLSAIACPIRGEGQFVEALYLNLPIQCGTQEMIRLAALASREYQQAEAVWLARKRSQSYAIIEAELSRAQAMQKRLIPQSFTAEGLDTAIGFWPCRWVGGDYVDAVQTGQPGRPQVLLAVADVCGKGLQAALVASCIHTMIHTSLRTGLQLKSMVEGINDHLRDKVLPENSFVTMLCMVLDQGSGKLQYANAGHPPAIIFEAGGGVRTLDRDGNIPIGIGPLEVNMGSDTLAPGELLVMYTDGLSEATLPDGEMLTDTGLADYLNANYDRKAGTSTGELADQLKEYLAQLNQDNLQQDDQTFLLVRRVPKK
ncbi:MAG: SpoIIE family protein phosphatase [Planctomycetes bacterium]|nr:SpoIIE family protein phosphatase [Planctomycetota bacterium]